MGWVGRAGRQSWSSWPIDGSAVDASTVAVSKILSVCLSVYCGYSGDAFASVQNSVFCLRWFVSNLRHLTLPELTPSYCRRTKYARCRRCLLRLHRPGHDQGLHAEPRGRVDGHGPPEFPPDRGWRGGARAPAGGSGVDLASLPLLLGCGLSRTDTVVVACQLSSRCSCGSQQNSPSTPGDGGPLTSVLHPPPLARPTAPTTRSTR